MYAYHVDFGIIINENRSSLAHSGVYRSAHKYRDVNDPEADPKYVTRTHPLVRTNPATGWKGLFVNQAMTIGIEGLDQTEANVILKYIFE